MQTKIIKNAIRCKKCGDIIESVHVHDFKTCSCGAVSVDGGHEYLRRCFPETPDDYEDLSETVEISDEEFEREQEERKRAFRKRDEESFREFLNYYEKLKKTNEEK